MPYICPMQNHTRVYLDYQFKVNHLSQHELSCEYCHIYPVVDVHHIIYRSHFGKKRKHEQDQISNLIGLCRFCHDKAHKHLISKQQLLDIARIRPTSAP